jgi:hypothetical protein
LNLKFLCIILCGDQQKGAFKVQVKQLIEMGQKGDIDSVTVASNPEGYTVIAKTSFATELLRTQLGAPKVYKDFNLLLKKLREANIHKCEVFNH